MRFSVIVLTLLALPWTGCSDGLQMMSTTSTNSATGAVTQRDVYTRDGQTNLIRNQLTLDDGTIQVLGHRLYREGRLAAMISDVQGNLNIMTEPKTAYGVSVEFHPDRTIRAVGLMGADGDIVDMFLATNSVIAPVSTPDLQRLQRIGSDTMELMRDAANTTPAEFSDKVKKLIERDRE
jgi:hypothetical protein